MFHFKADSIQFTLPSSYAEISVGQFFAYLDAGNDAEILSILSGVDLSVMRNLQAPELSYVLTNQLAYLAENPDFENLPVPKRITVNGKAITPPDNLGAQTTFGQKADVDAYREQLEKESKLEANYLTLCRMLLATYLYPMVTGQRYEESSNAESILPVIDQIPCTEAFALSAFFLRSWNTMKSTGGVKWTLAHPPKKVKPVGKLLSRWTALTSTIRSLPRSKSPKPSA